MLLFGAIRLAAEIIYVIVHLLARLGFKRRWFGFIFPVGHGELLSGIPDTSLDRRDGSRVTRINCIPPHELSGQHLVAEYRELPRVFALVRAAIARDEMPDDPRNPPQYLLGAGHVRFFYCRLGFLARRQAALVAEMKARGYQPLFVDTDRLLDGFPEAWCQDWEPTEEAIAINRARISLRLALRQHP